MGASIILIVRLQVVPNEGKKKIRFVTKKSITIRDTCERAYFVTFSNLHQVLFCHEHFFRFSSKKYVSFDVTTRGNVAFLSPDSLHFLFSLGMTVTGIFPHSPCPFIPPLAARAARSLRLGLD